MLCSTAKYLWETAYNEEVPPGLHLAISGDEDFNTVLKIFDYQMTSTTEKDEKIFPKYFPLPHPNRSFLGLLCPVLFFKFLWMWVAEEDIPFHVVCTSKALFTEVKTRLRPLFTAPTCFLYSKAALILLAMTQPRKASEVGCLLIWNCCPPDSFSHPKPLSSSWSSTSLSQVHPFALACTQEQGCFTRGLGDSTRLVLLKTKPRFPVLHDTLAHHATATSSFWKQLVYFEFRISI